MKEITERLRDNIGFSSAEYIKALIDFVNQKKLLRSNLDSMTQLSEKERAYINLQTVDKERAINHILELRKIISVDKSIVLDQHFLKLTNNTTDMMKRIFDYVTFLESLLVSGKKIEKLDIENMKEIKKEVKEIIDKSSFKLKIPGFAEWSHEQTKKK
jgi:archaellum biogenesis ATPase FlaH